MALLKNGVFTPDPWLRLDTADDLPKDGNVLLTAEQWRRLAPSPHQANVAYGLLLEPGTEVEEFAEHYQKLALVAINFPKFADGRGYSMAHKIRKRFGFGGELRAVGDVLFDQLQLMARCGFDAFDIVDPTTLKLLIEQGRRSGVEHFYQPGYGKEVPAGTRPWARRPVSS
jgi:uncharacterized protein (DUF934 family)